MSRAGDDRAAVDALRTALAGLHENSPDSSSDGNVPDAAPTNRLAGLLAAAVTHFAGLDTGPTGTVAAVALTRAVFRGLSEDPVPRGVLAAAAATYLAFVVLDDQMDGDVPAFWADRSPGEIVLGAQALVLVAGRVVGDGAPAPTTERLGRLHQELVTTVIEGQLRTEEPLAADTTPAEVAATISARSGAMLAGFAVMAAVAAGATAEEEAAARTIGHELGVARQHWNDLTELVGERTTDLRNGTATLATALAVQARSPQDRGALIDRLRTLAGDEHRDRLVRDVLGTAIAEVIMLVGLHRESARAATRLLVRDGMRHDDLDRLIRSTATTHQEPP